MARPGSYQSGQPREWGRRCGVGGEAFSAAKTALCASVRHTEAIQAKHHPCPHRAARGPPDGSLMVRAADLGTATRRPLAGDFPPETEPEEPLTSHPEPCSPPSG